MRTPTGRLLRFWLPVGGLVCALVVTGCSDPDQPATLPDDTPSVTSSSASRTPSTPEEEVEAAVRAYYAELTRAAQTNDTSVLRTLTTTGCPCFRPVKVIDRNERQGRTTPGAVFRVVALRVYEVDGRTAAAEVTTSEVAYKVLGSSDEVIGRVPKRRNHLELSLIRRDSGQWIIANEFDLEGNA